jgi:hypothetical protein
MQKYTNLLLKNVAAESVSDFLKLSSLNMIHRGNLYRRNQLRGLRYKTF